MSYVLKQSDIFDFARSIGADVRQKGNELFFKRCPKCNGDGHDKDTFSINLETGAFKCFRASCDYHGHFVELARDFGYPLDMGEPKTYRKLPQKPIETKPPAIAYMESRGISEMVTSAYNLTVNKNNPDILVFPFYDDKDILQFVKYRNTKYNGKGNKEWCEKDTKPILFGMNHCLPNLPLVITEGQIDSLSLAECGIANAVSVPTGATGFTWLNHCWEWILQFKTVIVFGDYEKGKMTLIDTLQARLPQKVLGVRAQDYLGEKDANAILQKFGEEALRTAVANAEPPKLSQVIRMADVKPVNFNELPRIKTNIKEIDRVLGGLLYGQLILLTGKRGEGKSTFMSQLICEAFEQGENVFTYSGELANYNVRGWIDFQLAGGENVITNINAYGDEDYSLPIETADKIAKWYYDKSFMYDNTYLPDNNGELESLVTIIEQAIKQYDIRLVCIDNLMTAMDTVDRQENLYLAQSNFLTDLKRLAMKYNVVVILVAHPRKSKESFTNDDVSGSSDITNKVDVVMSYGRVDNGDCDSKLQITKNRLTGKLAKGDNAIELFYSAKTKRIFSATSGTRHYGWEGKFYKKSTDEPLPF